MKQKKKYKKIYIIGTTVYFYVLHMEFYYDMSNKTWYTTLYSSFYMF